MATVAETQQWAMGPATSQWARIRPGLNYGLRRGAWYPVVRQTLVEAVLEVNQQPLAVPLPIVEIRPARPWLWTVVPLPRDAVNIPLSWGSRYAVCPNCRERMPLRRRITVLRCASCEREFEINWSERYGTGI
jgi:hypothetical protein